MGIAVTQHPSERYILVTFDEDWTWEDFMSIVAHAQQLNRAVSEPIQIIVDIRQTTLVPKDTIKQSRDLSKKLNYEAFDRIIVVGAVPLVKAVHRFLLVIDNRIAERMLFVDTMEEALAYGSSSSQSQV